MFWLNLGSTLQINSTQFRVNGSGYAIDVRGADYSPSTGPYGIYSSPQDFDVSKIVIAVRGGNQNWYSTSAVSFNNLNFGNYGPLVLEEAPTISIQFDTTIQEMKEWNFNQFIISGNYEITQDTQMTLNFIYKGIVYDVPLYPEYLNTNGSSFILKIPYNEISNAVVLKDGGEFEFYFNIWELGDSEHTYTINTGIQTFSLSQLDQDFINQANERKLQVQQHQETINELKQLEGSIGGLNNSLTDSNIDNDFYEKLENGIENQGTETLNTINNGISSIFAAIYDAFVHTSSQDVNIPIPYINENIIIGPHYFENLIREHGFAPLILLWQMFWMYLVSKYILIKVSHTIDKLSKLDFDKVETHNIEEDIL